MTHCIVSGGFDPLHVGHIDMMKKTKRLFLNCQLIVLLNSDEWLMKKKGFVFMSFDDRRTILESLELVDRVVPVTDHDDTVRRTLIQWRNNHPEEELVFVNGGDRQSEHDVPEFATCTREGIFVMCGIGDKIRSSSDMVTNANRK